MNFFEEKLQDFLFLKKKKGSFVMKKWEGNTSFTSQKNKKKFPYLQFVFLQRGGNAFLTREETRLFFFLKENDIISHSSRNGKVLL